jgi:orotidine-5'-phosphate decarboxylase
VGLVVGATDTAALQRVRKVAPTAWILCPGVGAQGGDLEVLFHCSGVASCTITC